MPDITFVNSPRTEEERLKMTARIIASGFYEKQGFVVLPELNKRVVATSQVIYSRKLQHKLIDVDAWTKEWERVGEQFWEYLEELVPNAILHGPIEIRLTRYGTVASGAKLGMIPHEKTIYYLRSDVDLSQLAAMMINNIMYYDRKNLGITWTKREVLMDFVMTRPAMKKLFPKFDPVFAQLSRVPAKVRRQSEVYLLELGVESKTPEFEIAKMRLSKLEKKVMRVLVDHQGELVSYDELADAVWGVGEFKTFWALNKLVERMRVKLDKLGIDGGRVESVRGQGYLLK